MIQMHPVRPPRPPPPARPSPARLVSSLSHPGHRAKVDANGRLTHPRGARGRPSQKAYFDGVPPARVTGAATRAECTRARSDVGLSKAGSNAGASEAGAGCCFVEQRQWQCQARKRETSWQAQSAAQRASAGQ